MIDMLMFLRTFVKKLVKKIVITLAVGGISTAIVIIFLNSLHIVNFPDSTATLQKQDAEIYTLLNDKSLNNTPGKKSVMKAYRIAMCPLVGIGCSLNASESDKYFDHSLMGYMSHAIVIPFKNMPASGIQDTYDTLANAGFVPHAMAAEGIGFGAIKPFRDIWKIFRNICYGLLAVVMVVMGILFLFRVKLGAQTAITMEAALPRIVIALLLITFSYSIAGFLIDLMYLLMALVISILGQGINLPPAGISKLQNAFMTAGAGDLLSVLLPQWSEMWKLSYAILDIFPIAIRQFIHYLSGGIIFITISYVMALIRSVGITEAFNGVAGLTFSWGNLPGVIISLLLITPILAIVSYWALPFFMALIIYLTVFFLFLRIFLMLVSTYLRILLMVLLAPFYMLFEAIPGQNSFSYWFRNMLGELITFPTIAGILMIGYLIVFLLTQAQPDAAPGLVTIIDTTIPFTPAPDATSELWQPPFLYGIDQRAFIVILGMGFIFIIPDLVQQFKNMLGVKPPPINVGLGAFFAGGGAAMMGAGMLVKGSLGLVQGIYGKDAGLARLGGLRQFGERMRQPFMTITKPDGSKLRGRKAYDYEQNMKGSATGSGTGTPPETGGKAIVDPSTAPQPQPQTPAAGQPPPTESTTTMSSDKGESNVTRTASGIYIAPKPPSKKDPNPGG